MPTTVLADADFENGGINILSLLVATGLCPSRGEARRLVQQGGIVVDEKLSLIHIFTVQTEKTGYKPIFLSADGGRAFSLRNGDAVEIRRSKYETKLVRLSNKSFCDILQKKMLMGVLGHEE